LGTIGSDREADEPSHVQGQHVTGRQGGDQHFLWINGGLDRPLAYNVWRGQGRDTVLPSKLTVWPWL
jgi:hypothetical protein